MCAQSKHWTTKDVSTETECVSTSTLRVMLVTYRTYVHTMLSLNFSAMVSYVTCKPLHWKEATCVCALVFVCVCVCGRCIYSLFVPVVEDNV